MQTPMVLRNSSYNNNTLRRNAIRLITLLDGPYLTEANYQYFLTLLPI